MAQAPVRLVADDQPREPLKFNFTKRQLDHFGAGKTRYYIYDTKTAKLCMLVTPAGSKSFYFAGRIEGRARRIKIGTYPEVTVEQARRQATKLSGQIVEGRNPADQRRVKRAELTFADLFAAYIEQHSKPHKRTWQEDQQKYDQHLRSLRSKKVSSIDRATVQSLITKLATGKPRPRPGAANRLRALLSSVFNFAADSLDLPIVNPVSRIKKYPEQPRERFLNADELTQFYAALKHEPQVFQDVFELLLLTGARSGNAKAARWDQIDLAESTWIIPASEAKSNRQIVVPLAARAVEILQRRLAEATDPDSPWVFPSHRRNPRTPHIAELKSSWHRIIKAAKLKDVRVHDLRHINATWQGKTGATLTTIGKSLGHRNVSTTLIYTQTELQQVRRSIDAAAEAMTDQAKGAKHG
jgi:integrase